MKKPIFVLAGLALLASGSFASLAGVNAADHRDSPSNVADVGADATDIYAFRSPTNPDNLVVALDVNPLIAPGDMSRGFDADVTYDIKIDRNGDLVPEATVKISRSGDNMVVEGLGSPITFPITPPGQPAMIATAGPIKAFAGLRDDPFFFDLTGFMAFTSKPGAPVAGLRQAGSGSPSDTFAGTNIASIVLELPVAAVTGGSSANSGTVKVVATVSRGGKQIDRISVPAVNTALIPSGKKDAFNAATDERQDVATFKSDVVFSISQLRGIVDGIVGSPGTGGPLGNVSPDALSGALVPYVVTLDFSKPLAFPNGRQLNDDVIDTVLGLVLNRGGPLGFSDGVNGNDKAFLGTFPYLAEPHTAAGGGGAPAAGGQSGAVRPPSTGDGGLLNDSSDLLALSAGLFVLAIVLGGGGVFAAMRNRSR